MSNSDPISCNRQPFLSDGECDRGSVDIHQFDDFPYCESFSPTLPDIPPEIIDNPINLPIPPACACFNIDYALKLKYSQDRKFAASGSFSAKGDCCEGNYVSNLNLQIPCPILGSGTSKKISMKIGYGKGKQSASVSYIRADKDSCAIEARNVNINLNIPCPINKSGSKKIKIGISYGKDFKSASASYLTANADSCTIEAYSPDFRLNIPCPILGRDENNRIKATMAWGSFGTSVSVSYIRKNTKECTIEPNDVTLNLSIPCPVKKQDKQSKVKFGVKWGSKSYVSASIIKTDASKCTIETNDATFNLEIKCPVKKDSEQKKVKFAVKWGSKSYVSASILKLDHSNCTIEANSASFGLEIPCPIRHTQWHIRHGKYCYAKWRRRWFWAGGYYGPFTSYSTSFLRINESSCTIEAGKLDLDIPCPIKRASEQKKVKFGVTWGSESYVSASILKVHSTDCLIETTDATFNLQVRCPLHHNSWHHVHNEGGHRKCWVTWRRRWTWDGGQGQYTSYSTSFIKIDESCCTIEAGKLDLDIPCPVIGDTGWRKLTLRRKWANAWTSYVASYAYVDKTACKVTTYTNTFNLEIPCPFEKTRLKIETSAYTTSASVGQFYVKTDSYNGTNCTRSIKLKAIFPTGGTAFGSSCSVISDIRYCAYQHALQIRTMNLKTKGVSAWKNVFTAVGHKSDHACCNDV